MDVTDRREQQGCCFEPATITCETLTSKISVWKPIQISKNKGWFNRAAPAIEVPQPLRRMSSRGVREGAVGTAPCMIKFESKH